MLKLANLGPPSREVVLATRNRPAVTQSTGRTRLICRVKKSFRVILQTPYTLLQKAASIAFIGWQTKLYHIYRIRGLACAHCPLNHSNPHNVARIEFHYLKE